MSGNKKTVPKYKGITYYESAEKKYKGKFDRCFYINYRLYGKKKEEKVGWLSEGYNAKYANQVREARLRQIRHGEELPSKHKRQITLGEVYEEYLEWAINNKKSWESDKYRWKHLSHLSGYPLESITPKELEKIKTTMKNSGLSPASIKHALVLVRQLYKFATNILEVYNKKSPTDKIKMPSVSGNQRVRYLTREEAGKLLERIKQSSQITFEICLLSLSTGMRQGEILNLRWQDINLENETIYISTSKNKESGECYMTEEVKEMFIEKKKSINIATGLVFPSVKDSKSGRVSNTFNRVVKELGLNENIEDSKHKVVFHSLRHTFASWFMLDGGNLYTLQKLMRHKDLKMTIRYAHLSPDHKQKAINTSSRIMPKYEGENIVSIANRK